MAISVQILQVKSLLPSREKDRMRGKTTARPAITDAAAFHRQTEGDASADNASA
jgi:hypothetical protein